MSLASRLLRTRWLVRAPIALFRLRLGWIFGTRMLLLEHRGRKTGNPRFVVLEVAERPEPDAFVVVAGLGPGSQWFRNIQANPDVRISVGTRREKPAKARVLTPDDGARAIARYRVEHPTAFAKLEEVMREWAEPLARRSSWEELVPVVELRLNRA
ncbi:nitroreductase family deazaflavin-dependent oxidoreductase [Antrihabitans cavernicola]|uniref:Nitroreductase family deazaflavin-dependent oxidoreductase n=1 Tax=Antrihabitans cavernicola TaxID=2495913 RepID=A0A5A7S782_9NOCA|nr:nitroreductase family deazaflavin-dependent oxidoreductase [Spelaeibacter cavernicola]KAA0022000.1 nitroreductase family deazaflavin-dependent oxidoreductase [Spelaeibacter cavernicola]